MVLTVPLNEKPTVAIFLDKFVLNDIIVRVDVLWCDYRGLIIAVRSSWQMPQNNHFHVYFICLWLIYDTYEVVVSLDGKVSHTGLVSYTTWLSLGGGGPLATKAVASYFIGSYSTVGVNDHYGRWPPLVPHWPLGDVLCIVDVWIRVVAGLMAAHNGWILPPLLLLEAVKKNTPDESPSQHHSTLSTLH